MKKDITLATETMTREKFIADIADTIFCPESYNLVDHKQCSTYICRKCWTDALRGIKFKGEW